MEIKLQVKALSGKKNKSVVCCKMCVGVHAVCLTANVRASERLEEGRKREAKKTAKGEEREKEEEVKGGVSIEGQGKKVGAEKREGLGG